MTRSDPRCLRPLTWVFCVAVMCGHPQAVAQVMHSAQPPTVKLSPRVRVESLANDAMARVRPSGMDAFFEEIEVMTPADVELAPRIVATPENRLILGKGDRAFARAGSGTDGPWLTRQQGHEFRIGRMSRPLRDPATGEVLGHEVQFLGAASLMEEEFPTRGPDGKAVTPITPAVVRITAAKQDIRTGDRLFAKGAIALDEVHARQPSHEVHAQVLGVYGNGVTFAGQNQIVVINQGKNHGLEAGHLLFVLKDSRQVSDSTDGKATALDLSGEAHGRVMVFRSFDKVAYALILQNLDVVKVGDRITAR